MVYLIVTFLILKFRKSKFDLKANFVNNYKNSNACRFLNPYALKWYEARRLKKSFWESNVLKNGFSIVFLGSSSKESFSTSSNFVSNLIELSKLVESSLKGDPLEGSFNLDQYLNLVHFLSFKMNIFFEQGALEPFFRLLFYDYPKIVTELDASWGMGKNIF